MTDPTPQTTHTRDEAVRTPAALAAFLRISSQRRDIPESVRQQITEAADLLSAPAPASGRVDAVQSLHHESGERITRKDLNDAYRKGAEDGRLATLLIDSMFDGPVANAASLSPAATPVSEAGGERKGYISAENGQGMGLPERCVRYRCGGEISDNGNDNICQKCGASYGRN